MLHKLRHMRMHGFAGKCWKWCHRKAVGLLVLRVALGAFFIAHGVSKFQNMAIMKEFFGSLGLWTWTAPFVGTVEILSGLALVLGAYLWPAALGITGIMVVAIWKVTGNNVYGQPFLMHFVSGWGPNLIYAAAALALAFTGAGRYSVTAWFLRRFAREGWCRDCMDGHGCEPAPEEPVPPQA
jgi:putative oxidoreductase